MNKQVSVPAALKKDPERTIVSEGVRVHIIKEFPEYFADLVLRRRRFEIRLDDRNYQPGEYLVIREFIPVGNDGAYTGRQVQRKIHGVYKHPNLPGLMVGWIAMQLSDGPED